MILSYFFYLLNDVARQEEFKFTPAQDKCMVKDVDAFGEEVLFNDGNLARLPEGPFAGL